MAAAAAAAPLPVMTSFPAEPEPKKHFGIGVRKIIFKRCAPKEKGQRKSREEKGWNWRRRTSAGDFKTSRGLSGGGLPDALVKDVLRE